MCRGTGKGSLMKTYPGEIKEEISRSLQSQDKWEHMTRDAIIPGAAALLLKGAGRSSLGMIGMSSASI